MPRMKDRKKSPSSWFGNVDQKDSRNVLSLIKKMGPLSIRAFDSDVLVEKTFAWGSRKPSKTALQKAFYCGELIVSERLGMLIKYDLLDRHFAWQEKPKPASNIEYKSYLLERSLRSQAIVSLDSICHLDAPRKKSMIKSF